MGYRYVRIGHRPCFELGAEDVVLVDLISRLNKKTKIFTLDTGRLNQETYDIIDVIRKRYDITIEIYFENEDDVEQMVRTKGLNLMYDSIDNRKLCCEVRKVRGRLQGTKQS